MKKALAVLLTAILVQYGSIAISGAQTPPTPPPGSDPIRRVPQPVVGSYIVLLRDVSRADVPSVATNLSRASGGTLGYVYTEAVRGFSIRMSEAAARALAANPLVASVEEDGVVREVESQSNPPYGLDRIDQRDLPLSSSYDYNASGAGVTAYILDTGILASHQDFGGRASVGTDVIGDGRNGVDCDGHGTHVAGTLGGTTYGVAKQVSLVAVRVLDCQGSGTDAGVIAGIDWVTGNAVKPAVANMSLGGGASTSLDTALRNSIASGLTYSVAAGNGNFLGFAESACNSSPARVAEALTVSATDSSDRKPSWANTGSCLDVFAPGVGVKSAWNTGDTSTQTLDGTSMAAPHVAGAAVLYLQGNAQASPSSLASALINNSTAGKVQSAGSGSPNRLLYMGFIGGGGGGGTNTAPAANFNFSCTGLTCSFTDTSTDSAGTISSRAWNFGDGNTSTQTNPTHTYGAASTYTVSLTVTDNAGATNSTQKNVTVTSSSDPDPNTPNLTNGQARSDTSAASGSWKYYKIAVPAGRSSLVVELTSSQSCGFFSCNPELDLYVRRASKPTTGSYNCRINSRGSSGRCSISNPAADYWYVGVYTRSGSASLRYDIKATY